MPQPGQNVHCEQYNLESSKWITDLWPLASIRMMSPGSILISTAFTSTFEVFLPHACSPPLVGTSCHFPKNAIGEYHHVVGQRNFFRSSLSVENPTPWCFYLKCSRFLSFARLRIVRRTKTRPNAARRQVLFFYVGGKTFLPFLGCFQEKFPCPTTKQFTRIQYPPSHPNGFCFGNMLLRSFDYLMYPYYPAYTMGCYQFVISGDNENRKIFMSSEYGAMIAKHNPFLGNNLLQPF